MIIVGYSDLGEAWRVANYEEDNIESMVDELWKTLKPIYTELHAYVRRKLRKKYPDRDIGDTIPAHLLGNYFIWVKFLSNLSNLSESTFLLSFKFPEKAFYFIQYFVINAFQSNQKYLITRKHVGPTVD